MKEDRSSICPGCCTATEGPMFESKEEERGICSLCKIVEQERELQESKEQIESFKYRLEELNKTKDFYYKQYNEYMQEAVKYRSAFKSVMEELLK